MNVRTGDIWKAFDDADLFLITTNGVITYQKKLVMGRGIAQQARDRFPGIDKILAKTIEQEGVWDGSRRAFFYGLITGKKIGIFQTKYQWSEPAELALIEFSAVMLGLWCQEHPDKRIHLNFPGIGSGKLAETDVYPIIAFLPDTVTVWKRGL